MEGGRDGGREKRPMSNHHANALVLSASDTRFFLFLRHLFVFSLSSTRRPATSTGPICGASFTLDPSTLSASARPASTRIRAGTAVLSRASPYPRCPALRQTLDTGSTAS